MGTLTSCSFSVVNLGLQWSPISSTFRKRIELFVRKSNCFFCKEVSKRHRVLNRNFGRSWCFGANNNGDNDGNSSNNASNDSNLATTTSRDKAEENAQSSDDFDSDKSKASISSRRMHTATVWVHPLVIVGWCGLTTSAFNMLPMGCLDGGRGIQLGGPLSLPWDLYVLICQRAPEKPCLNDVTKVGTWRRTVLTVAIFLVVLTLLPVWDEPTEELGIGLVTAF